MESFSNLLIILSGFCRKAQETTIPTIQRETKFQSESTESFGKRTLLSFSLFYAE